MCCSGLGHLLRPSSSGPFIDVGFGQAPIVWPLVCAASTVSFGGLFLGPYSDIHQLVEPRLACGSSFVSPSFATIGSFLLRAVFACIS